MELVPSSMLEAYMDRDWFSTLMKRADRPDSRRRDLSICRGDGRRSSLSALVAFAIVIPIISVLIALDFWMDRLVMRAMFSLVDRLPIYRANGRYRSHSQQKYTLLRKPRNDG
jgi:hypothetical protein